MKAPLSWLKEFVSIEMSVEELASWLALTGTEVERVALVGVSDDGENASRFVVGKVLERAKHPDADKLSVCTVDVGETEPRTIVCGAPNVDAGQTVGVVLPGGMMPNGMNIKEAKLRGVKSSGMILSEAELGLAAKSDGTMELPSEWQAGEPLSRYFPLTDWVLEVEVTPNRPDCLSVRGLAREIAAIAAAPFSEELEFSFPVGERLAEEDIAIEVLDPDLCPRYAARVICGVRIAESPLWLKARIVQAGMRPVNNVVDVTNYVLWALGQPMHAFDLRTIGGGRIIVRRAHPGEEITTLDNEHRVLTEDMLVIADAERASVVAGIMGGLDSEVTDETTDILLEAANFAGPSIMRTSGALGLRSEASTRYEKGLDPEMIPLAMDMACKLFVEVCGGEVSKGTIDVRVPPRPQSVISLRLGQVERVLGLEVPVTETVSILSRLGCRVEESGESLAVTVPEFRRDLEREIDLIEEIARVHGLERIPSTLPARRVGRGGLDRSQSVRRLAEDLLVGAGLSQAITYSFGDDRWAERLRLPDDDQRREAVVVSNPLSVEQSRMRRMLLPGLLDTARTNQAVREYRVALFEVGRVFYPTGELLPLERTMVSFLIAGDGKEESWLAGERPVDYFLAKGLVERLEAGLKARLFYTPAAEPFLHPGKSAVIRTADGRLAGWVGEIHPLVVQSYDLRSSVVVAAEIDLDVLCDASVEVPSFKDLLAYPVVEQDLALVVGADVPAAELVSQLRAAGGELLEDVAVFDVYEGAQVGQGKKSLALRLSFRAPDRTLNDTEINELRSRILVAVKNSVGAELRT